MTLTRTPSSAPDRPLRQSRLRSRPMVWRMMAQLGIDPHGRWWHGSEGTLSGVMARCMACTHTEACATWLAGARSSAAAPGFCPNALHFTACRPGQPSAGPEPDHPEHRALLQALTKALQIARETTRRRLAPQAL